MISLGLLLFRQASPVRMPIMVLLCGHRLPPTEVSFGIVREAQRKPMLGRVLILFLAAVTPLQMCSAQATEPRYSITISPVNTTAKVGSEFRVKIVQTNTTGENQYFLLDANAPRHGEYLYRIDAWLSDGRSAPRSKYFQEVRDDAGKLRGGTGGNAVMIRKKPGESIVSSIDLNELYDLQPGEYTVQVYQKDSIAKTTVKSNIITVTVTP